MSSKKPQRDIKKEGENLKKAFKLLKIRANAAANKIGVSQSLVSDICRGAKKIQPYHFLLFELVLSINPEYIKNGTEPVSLPRKSDNIAMRNKVDNHDSNNLYEQLIQAKEEIIKMQKEQIEALEHDKKHMQGMLDITTAEIGTLKREITELEKSKTSA